MQTSLLLALAFALTPTVAPHAPTAEAAPTPVWLRNYAEARRQGAQRQKPLAVFVGQGDDGWRQLIVEQKLGPATRTLLQAEYVCLYVDLATDEGRRLGEAFECPSGPGLVISDRTGLAQAFRHEGTLSAVDLITHLEKFADPQYVVRTTETAVKETIRFYPPQQSYAPVFASPAMGQSC